MKCSHIFVAIDARRAPLVRALPTKYGKISKSVSGFSFTKQSVSVFAAFLPESRNISPYFSITMTFTCGGS